MPDPIIPYPLDIRGLANSTAGTVIVENLTKVDADNPNKNRESANIDSNQRANIDLANLRSGYDNGDLILIKMVGIRSGNAYHIVDTKKGRANIVLTESGADYVGASVTL